MKRNIKPISETHPELAAQAYGWDCTLVPAGTHKRLRWKCSQGHIWDSSGNNRLRGRGCPVCSNRKVLIGFNDLATTHPELAAQAYGWDPTKIIAGTAKKLNWKCSKDHVWVATGHTRLKRNSIGCPYCSNQKVLTGFNDLATTHPELAKEAYDWDPTKIIAGTNKKLKWKCPNNHIWMSTGSDRILKNSNCSFCSNRYVSTGFNDLATTHPELAKEAYDWDPTKIIAGTHQKLLWKCSKGHIWKSTGSHRVSGRNCPSCSITGYDPNKKGYLYFLIHPIFELYQIGITNEPSTRLKDHKRLGFEVLDLRGPSDGYAIKELELSILKYLRAKGAKLSPTDLIVKFNGITETWTIDSFKVNNLKELINQAVEAGF